MFSKILVGYDGSPSSKKGLETAAELAKAFKAKIILGTVIENVIIPTQDGTLLPVLEIMDKIQAEMKSLAANAVDGFRKKYPAISIEEKIAEGRPAERLIEIATQEKCDLIIVGHCGHSGLRERFIGSTTHNITNNALCPVLVIR